MGIVPQDNLRTIVQALDESQIVAVPTETVYGLAVRLDQPLAIKHLLELKERQNDASKVLSIMLPNIHHISRYAIFTPHARRTAQRFFPGELTLVLPKSPDFDHIYFDNFRTVGIRIPAHDYMQRLLHEVGALLVTSANPRGETPCLNADQVAARLPQVPTIVSGHAGGNLPSTVLDYSDPATTTPETLRQGGLLIVRY